MQLKIVTQSGTFRYNQSGQAITQINEPFVLVEVNTKEEVAALYDQGQEHLAQVFTYDGDQITGMSADAGPHIQNFFLAEGAWYLQELNPADQDRLPSAVIEATIPSVSTGAVPSAEPGPATEASGDPSLFVPNAEQRQLLRDIQTTAEALRRIEPEPNASWDRQVQKLLLAQQIFGINDPDQAFPQGKIKLEELLVQARSKGIPEEVVHTNTTMGCGDDFEQSDEEEF
jgi:hypothetical protein